MLQILTILNNQKKEKNMKKTKKIKDMTQISLSMETKLVKLIDIMAKNDNRNRSNFIANVMQKLASAFKNEEQENEK